MQGTTAISSYDGSSPHFVYFEGSAIRNYRTPSCVGSRSCLFRLHWVGICIYTVSIGIYSALD